jgi:hypothetical protein
MVSPSRVRTPSTVWQFALIGALASLPVSVVLNWLPNSEATIGGGIIIVGAFIAGVISATRSTNPGAAGLRTGFLGGVLAVLTFIVTEGTMAVWPPSRIVFWTFAGGVVLCVAPIFGLGCGRVGGWVANTVTSRWKTGVNVS